MLPSIYPGSSQIPVPQQPSCSLEVLGTSPCRPGRGDARRSTLLPRPALLADRGIEAPNERSRAHLSCGDADARASPSGADATGDARDDARCRRRADNGAARGASASQPANGRASNSARSRPRPARLEACRAIMGYYLPQPRDPRGETCRFAGIVAPELASACLDWNAFAGIETLKTPASKATVGNCLGRVCHVRACFNRT